MKVEQALAIVDRSLEEKLSDLDWLILHHSWQGKTYLEIADDCGYSPDYIREHGAKLWRSLSTAFKIKVTKKNWKRILEKYEPLDGISSTKILIYIKIGKKQSMSLIFFRHNQKIAAFKYYTSDVN